MTAATSNLPPSTHRCVRLRHRPSDVVRESDLEVCAEPLPQIGDGQVLVKNLVVSVDPTHRIWMSDVPQYMPCVEVGDVMRAVTVGVVVETRCADEYPVGSYVAGMGGVAEYYAGTPGVTVTGRLPDGSTSNLSVCSVVIGLTAWHGVNKVLEPITSDDVVVVSGAAGAVGSLAAQLCKLKGARKVIGIAGGPDKCRYLVDELGLDAAVDYRDEKDVGAKIRELCGGPERVTRYFDNVGGGITESVLNCMSNFSKFAYCGSISEYNGKFGNGIRNFNMILMRRMNGAGVHLHRPRRRRVPPSACRSSRGWWRRAGSNTKSTSRWASRTTSERSTCSSRARTRAS